MKSEVQVLLEKQIKLLEDIIVGKDKIIEMQKEKITVPQSYVYPTYPDLLTRPIGDVLYDAKKEGLAYFKPDKYWHN